MIRRNLLLAAVSALALGGVAQFAPTSTSIPFPFVSAAFAQEASDITMLRERADARWAALGFETRLIEANGVELYVAMAGEGPALLLLHGYPQSGEIWRHVAAGLAQDHRVIIPDLRGFGLSEIVADGYDLSTVSEDIHQLVRTLGHDRVEIVAHDWGGAVAATYALRYRDEVGKLAFMESAVAGLGFEDVWNFSAPNPAMTFVPVLLSEDLTEDLIRGREEIFMEHLWSTFTANKDAVPFLTWQPYLDAMRRPGLLESSASYYRSVYDQIDVSRALVADGKLSIPVLSISGAASFGDAQRTFVAAFADNIVDHVTIEGAGHFVAEEQPEALMNALRPFLAD